LVQYVFWNDQFNWGATHRTFVLLVAILFPKIDICTLAEANASHWMLAAYTPRSAKSADQIERLAEGFASVDPDGVSQVRLFGSPTVRWIWPFLVVTIITF